MNTPHNFDALRTRDGGLRWTMRLIGLLLVGAAVFFIQRDVFTTDLSVAFLYGSVALGVLTFVSSLLPPPRERLQEKPVFQPVSTRELTDRRR